MRYELTAVDEKGQVVLPETRGEDRRNARVPTLDKAKAWAEKNECPMLKVQDTTNRSDIKVRHYFHAPTGWTEVSEPAFRLGVRNYRLAAMREDAPSPESTMDRINAIRETMKAVDDLESRLDNLVKHFSLDMSYKKSLWSLESELEEKEADLVVNLMTTTREGQAQRTFREALMQSPESTEEQAREWFGEDGVEELRQRREQESSETTKGGRRKTKA